MTWGAGLLSSLENCGGSLQGIIKIFKNTAVVHIELSV